ncbi:type II toxin-antitoxin system HipA family toxin [Hyphomicrobium sp.]|uniref:type II toxin-antitoxin system HipA family toxin n=1 Tax=Hyphomicrobium sp. TaxID=82 RepID=UPI002FDF99F7
MTSKKEAAKPARPPEEAPKEVFVWLWLPDETEPVIAGRIETDGKRQVFNYGRSYLGKRGALPIYEPELPLKLGVIEPMAGLTMAGCLRDGAPDAWGRRVIINRMFGHKGEAIDVGQIDELTYLLQSGSDRIGALDFQTSSSKFVPRLGTQASLEELLSVAELVEKGVPITPELEQAVFHGTSLGGARPKAAIETAAKKYIAKFSASTDITNVVKAEFVAMRMAAKLGLNVAQTELKRAGGKDVILIERFDRVKTERGWTRKSMVSALTLFGLDEMMGRYGSYQELADIIRKRFTEPKKTLLELFARLVFNVLCGNTDDHARNHAAFWNGETLSLTPAYDICPQTRNGREANQALFITGEKRMSTLATCLEAAPHFLLSEKAALELIERQVVTIRASWLELAEEAALTEIDRGLMWGRQFLNPYAFEDAPEKLAALA